LFLSLKIFTNFVRKSGYIAAISLVDLERFGVFLLLSFLAATF